MTCRGTRPSGARRGSGKAWRGGGLGESTENRHGEKGGGEKGRKGVKNGGRGGPGGVRREVRGARARGDASRATWICSGAIEGRSRGSWSWLRGNRSW